MIPPSTRLLVAIASYGTRSDRFLARLIQEYRSMSFKVDVVVLSNIHKDAGEGVEVVVGLPDKDPWSLPFAHQRIFADRLNDYDLFLYSEDDTLVTEKNIQAFLRVSEVLPEDEVPGFLRFEEGPGEGFYIDIHAHYHWDTASIRRRGAYTLAHFTNEHSACYLLKRGQLRRAIDSGGYLVGPHKGKHDLLCSAATDVYTQCGLEKLICVSHVDDFLLHHIPNKYLGSRFGIREAEFRRQINALLTMAEAGTRPAPLFSTETRLSAARHSKDYYEPPRQELESIIPPSVRTVLSIGCGWGEAEAWLAETGLRVTAVPLDPVIPGGAVAAGVELVYGDLEAARTKLAGRKFDCLLLLNVLHLVEDPVALLSSYKELLSESSIIISLVPNMARVQKFWTEAGRKRHITGFDYQSAGTHFVSHKVVRQWYRAAGARVRKTIDIVPPPLQRLSTLTLSLADSFLSSEFFSIAKMK